MAYSAVPTVATGDTWTAANHNAYIKDNFAAGVPDIFTAKGDLAVATAADAAVALGVGPNYQTLIADSGEASGVKWGSQLQFTGRLTNGSWDGDTKTTGTYTIAANTFNANLPNAARALLVSLSARWTTANNGNSCNIRKPGEGNNGVLVRGLVANFFVDNMGIVPLDGSGQFEVVVSTASAEVYIDVWGYIY